jgi:hypothetical protein
LKSAFDFYCEAKGDKYRKKHPDATDSQLNEILRERFNSMPSDRMEKYTSLERRETQQRI